MLEANPDKINWEYLSLNPAAIHLLKANPNKIEWTYVGSNDLARINYTYYLEHIVNNSSYILK